MSVTVPCTFSAASYRVLAGIAAVKGTQVHRLIEAQVVAALTHPEARVKRGHKAHQFVTDEDKLRWMHMWMAGMTDLAIAKECDRNPSTVSQHLRQMGCPPRGKGGPHAKDPIVKSTPAAPQIRDEEAAA